MLWRLLQLELSEAAITNSTAVMLTSVAGDNYSIGFVSFGALNDSVKIDGADATVANAINGTCDIGIASRGLKKSEKSKGVQKRFWLW